MARTFTLADFDALSANRDMDGNVIEVGTRVRSYDHAMWSAKSETVFGCDETGNVIAYMEGTVVEVGVWIEGCPRYAIRVDTIRRGEDFSHPTDEYIAYPPVNGTPATFCSRVTFGVFAQTSEA